MSSSLLPFVIVIAVSVIALLVFATAKGRGSSQPGDSPLPLEVRQKRYFFSQAERVFFTALLKATKDLPITVLSKVKLNDLLEATGDNKQANNNRINRMHVDFVLLSQPDFQPLVVIELDGASHGSQTQQTRDAKKDAALKAAGLPLLRFPNGVQPAQFAPLLEPYLKIGTPQVSKEAEQIRAMVGRRAKVG